jgi:hypothetical protein
MSRPNALPIGQQLLLDLLAPPAITFFWWGISKARARQWFLTKDGPRQLDEDEDITVQGWIEDGWKYLLGILYVLVFSMTTYAYFTQ